MKDKERLSLLESLEDRQQLWTRAKQKQFLSCLEMGFCYPDQADLKFFGSSGPPYLGLTIQLELQVTTTMPGLLRLKPRIFFIPEKPSLPNQEQCFNIKFLNLIILLWL